MLPARLRSLLAKTLLALLAPLLFAALAEGLLRVAGVGYPTRFLVPDRIGERDVYRDNLFFTYRFFAPTLARSPSPIVLDRHKPKDAFRVVVLGESAAQGDPAPEFGVARLLAPLLQANLATGKVEVINAAVTAINSPVILEIARDLPRMQPDLVVLYVGNNEVIGPYGPGTVFTRFFDADWVPALAMRLSRLRLPQIMRLAWALAADRRAPQTFAGVEMFAHNVVAADDPRLATMRRRYQTNVRRLIARAQAAGARVLVSSVAVNMDDCPPSASIRNPALSPAERDQWNRAFTQGLEARQAGDWAGALARLREAEALDAGHAETQYLLGQCLDRLEIRPEADAGYRRARDLDGFRYRTDAAQNAILRACAQAEPAVLWADAETAFRNMPDARDADLFVDHVHFTFAGTYRLARLWAETIVAGWRPGGPFRSDSVFPAEPELREQLLFTPLAELALVQPMIDRFQRPPFDRQLDRDARLAKLRKQADALAGQVQATEFEPLRARFAELFRRFPGDPYWTKQWGQWLLEFRRYVDMPGAMADSIARYPHLVIPRALAAQALATLGKPAEAADLIAGWNRKHGFFLAAEMGPQVASLAANGQLAEAAAFARAVEKRVRGWDYRHRIRREAERAEHALRDVAEAKARIDLGQDAQAAPLLERANRTIRCPDPAYWMGGIQARRRQNPMPYLRQAFQTWAAPRSAYHAGLWRAKAGAFAEAHSYFATATKGAGDDFELVRSLAWLYLAHPNENVRHPELAAALAPALERALALENGRLTETLAAVLAAGGQWERAAELADQAVRQAAGAPPSELADELAQTRESIAKRVLPAQWPRHQVPMNFF